MANIKDLVAKKTLSKAFEYPDALGFIVTLNYLSQSVENAIAKKATIQKFKNHQPTNELDSKKLNEELAKNAIDSWEGLTVGILKTLCPIDPNIDFSDDQIIEYTKENAEMLLLESRDFNQWLGIKCFDIEQFIAERGETEKNSKSSSNQKNNVFQTEEL